MSKQTSLMSVLQRANYLLLTLVLACFGHAASAAPGDVLFSDDFQSGFGQWSESGPGDASIGNETSNSGNRSMRLRWNTVTAMSDAFNANVPAAELSVWIRRGDDSFSENPEGGEDLTVGYINSGGNTVVLETFPGGDTPGEIFSRVYTLPASALHANLRLSFQLASGNGSDFDYWHVDDVIVTETAAGFVGTGTGLTGAYCNRDTSNETVPCTTSPDVTRIDSTIDFQTGDAGWPAAGVDADTFSVRWTGEIQAQHTEDYRIHTISDDGIRVFIDLNQDGDFNDAGETVIDNYTDHAPTEDISSQISLVQAERYDIVIEYYENAGGNVARLLWSSPSTAPVGNPVIVPQTQLYPDSSPSARAEYRFDESVWDGTTDEVQDSSGNNLHGTAQGGATTASTDPAIGGDPGTCGYGTFDGNDDYVEVSNLSSELSGTASLAFWIKTTQNGNDTGWQAPGISGVEEAGGADDIFWGWIDAAGRIGISVGNDYAADQKSSSTINDDSWHHVVLTRDANTGATKIYIDGNLETSGNTGAGVIGNSFSSIGRIEDTGGSPVYFDGDLDEVRIYDVVLTDSNVVAVRDSTHPCAGTGALAEYRLDESSWSGAGSVIDSSGNGNDGSPAGNVSPDGTDPAIAGDPGTCGYASIPDNRNNGVIDAINTGLDINAVGNSGTITFWYQANDDWRDNNRDRMLFDASSTTDNKYFYLVMRDRGRLKFGLEDDNDSDFELETNRFNFNSGEWVHIAVTWDLSADELEIFINGVLDDSENISSNGALGDAGPLYFGDNSSTYQASGSVGNSADGFIDEVRIYNQVLGQPEIQAIRDDVHPCVGIDHFNISVNASASTCVPHQVTITARDASDNLFSSYNGTINLTTSTSNGNWSVDTGTGTLSPNPDTDDNGAASYTFQPADGGTVVMTLDNQHAEDLTISVVDNTIPSTLSTSGTISFRDNAFVLTEDPLQVAGRPQTIDVAIWRRDTSTGDCAIADRYTGSKPLKAWMTRDADDPGGTAPTVGATSLPNAVPGGNNLTLNFTAGQASFTLDTTDVGKYAINLRDDSRTFAGTVDIDGATGVLTERPFALAFTNINAGGTPNPAASSPTGNVFTTAGSNFALTLGAYLWQSADDANDDGLPDGSVDITDNGITPSFAWDTSVSAIQNTPSAGVGGVLGTLNNANQLVADFSLGTATPGDIQYMEVGSILLNATVTDFLNTTGSNVGGDSRYDGSTGIIGRFAADHFEFTVNTAPVFDPGCGNFTYIDQPFDFSTTPQITARAMAFNGVTPLQNYHDFTGSGGNNWWKLDLDPVTGSVDPAYTDAGIAAELVLDDAVSGYTPTSGSGSNGSIQFSLSGPLTYADRNAAAYGPVAAFDADVRLDFTVTDDDTATGTRVFNPVSFPQPNQRWGRLRLTNAAGSELLPLSIPVIAEYYDGSAFITNTDDSCTALDLANDIGLSNPDTAGGSVQSGDSVMTVGGGTSQVTSADPVQLASGVSELIFSAPGENNTGYIDIVTDLDGAGLTHLEFAWNGDNDYSDTDNEPAARATFGIYEGQHEIIYIREPW